MQPVTLERTCSAKSEEIVEDAPRIEHFYLLVKEVKERAKVGEALCAFIEDFVEVETTMGRQLIKVGNSACSTIKIEGLSVLSGGWDGFYRFSVALGKEHTAFGTNLVKSISNVLPDQVRQTQRSVHTIFSKTQASTDELKKLIRSFFKSKENYARLIQETEVAIRARDAALRESEVHSESHNQDEGFIRKMLKPNVAKLQDKCCDLIREIGSAETQLTMTTRMLNTMRESLLEDYRRGVAEVIEIDRNRLINIGESLNKLIISAELIHDRLDKSIQAIRTQSVNLDTSDNFRYVTEAVAQPHEILKWADLAQLLPPETLESISVDSPVFPINVFFKTDKAVVFLDIFKSISARAMQSLAELVDCERTFRKSSSKILERHGVGKNTAGSFMEYLENFESPSTRTAWTIATQMLNDSCNVHSAISNSYENAYNITLNKLNRALEVCKYEIVESVNDASKKVETEKLKLSKLATKLSKIQNELLDRKETIAKRETGSAQSAESVAAAISLYDESTAHYLSDDESCLPSEDNSKGNETKAASPGPKQQPRRTSMMDMIGGATKAVKEAVRTTTLGAVVGMETKEERFARIEKRIVTLEQEEKETIKSIKMSLGTTKDLLDSIERELSAVLEKTRELVDDGASILKETLVEIADANLSAVQQSIAAVSAARNSMTDIDTKSDMVNFIDRVKDASGPTDSGFIIELPTEVSFAVITSEIIDDERRQLRLAMTSTATSDSLKANSSSLQETAQLEAAAESRTLSSEIVILEGPKSPQPQRRRSKSCSGATEALLTPEFIQQSQQLAKEISVNDGNIDIGAFIENSELVSSEATPVENASSTSSLSIVFPSIETPVEELAKLRSPAVNEETPSELQKFGIPPGDKCIISYSCALYPKRGMLTHGRMYVTQNFIAFSGIWPEIRVLLHINQLISVEKKDSVIFIANAVLITTYEGIEYSFGSFVDRDHCYSLLHSMVEASKNLREIQSGRSIVPPSAPNGDKIELSVTQPKTLTSPPVSPKSPSDAEAQLNKVEPLVKPVTFAPLVDMKALFKRHDIAILHESTFPHSASLIYSSCWESCKGYWDFLTSQGELQIECADWVSFPGKVVPEDPTKSVFNQCRKVSYLHPRADVMTIFGPKNAPTAQMHYLHASNNDFSHENSYIIMTVTQFDGIPMADMFKIVQYWSFQPKSTTEVSLIVGVHVHFVKSTMFKHQVVGNVREELTVLAKKWVTFAGNRAAAFSPTEIKAVVVGPREVVLQETVLDSEVIITPRQQQHSNINFPSPVIQSSSSIHSYLVVFMGICLGVLLLMNYNLSSKCEKLESSLLDVSTKLNTKNSEDMRFSSQLQEFMRKQLQINADYLKFIQALQEQQHDSGGNQNNKGNEL